jgi:integrase
MCRRYGEARRLGAIGGGHRLRNRQQARYCGSDSTIRRELNVLSAAAHHAKRWKRLTIMPSIELPKERLLGPDDEAPFYTKDELHHLISMADGELRWFIELAYWTGARRNSIEDLERSQVRWSQNQIILQKPGKMATRKRQPIVPIFEPMVAPLKALWDHGGEKRLFKCTNFYPRYHRLCCEQGMESRSKPHILRHTRATHLLQDGKPLYAVARLLGDTVATVERVYGHHSSGYLHTELSELGG